MSWQKLMPLPRKGNPCLCCPAIGAALPAEALVAVGFGSATVERDGVTMLDGEAAFRAGREVTAADAEALAEADPDHDWRIVLHGPLHGEEYQRHGPGQWMLVIANEGFA